MKLYCMSLVLQSTYCLVYEVVLYDMTVFLVKFSLFVAFLLPMSSVYSVNEGYYCQ